MLGQTPSVWAMKMVDSGPGRDLHPVVFQGSVPLSHRPERLRCLMTQEPARAGDQWDTMPCPRARQHLSPASGRLQAADPKARPSLCTHTRSLRETLDTSLGGQTGKRPACHPVFSRARWLVSVSPQSQTTEQLCNTQNGLALRSHTLTLHLTQAEVTRQSTKSLQNQYAPQDSVGTSGMSLTLGLRHKPSAGNHSSAG